MKKIVLSALCALGCAALFAADYDDSSLLYWMIGDNPYIYGGGSVSDYAVRVGVSGGTYLNLYGEPGYSAAGTYIDDASLAQGIGLYAGVGNLDPAAAIFVELYNGEGGQYGGIANIGTVGNLARYITAGSGMADQVDPVVVSSFVIPEPTSGLLMLLGVAALSLRRKVKKA